MPHPRLKNEPPGIPQEARAAKRVWWTKCYAHNLAIVSGRLTNKLRRRCSSRIPELDHPFEVPGREGVRQAEHEVLQPRFEPRLDVAAARVRDVSRPLDLLRVTPDLLAPLIEDGRLMGVLVGRADRVPHLRVLGDQP